MNIVTPISIPVHQDRGEMARLCGPKHDATACFGFIFGECCNWQTGMCGTGVSCIPQFCDPGYGECDDPSANFWVKREWSTIFPTSTIETISTSSSVVPGCDGAILALGAEMPSTACGWWKVLDSGSSSVSSTTSSIAPATSTSDLTTDAGSPKTIVHTEKVSAVDPLSAVPPGFTPAFSGRLDPHQHTLHGRSEALMTDAATRVTAAVAGMVACALLAFML